MGLHEDTARRLEPIRARPATSAVLLDLDGTLAPIVERPQDVRVPGATAELLPLLIERYGLVAFISGRALVELRRIVGVDGAAYSGNHGAEIVRVDGRPLPVQAPAGAEEALRGFAAGWGPAALAPGVWLEDKGATLTFHYRTAPDPPAAAGWLDRHVAPAARAAGLLAEPGRMSLEIHPPGRVTKGSAARALLAELPAIRNAVSLGDDRTDVTVWTELRALVAAGRLDASAAVGIASDETPDVVRAEADVLVAGTDGACDVLRHLAGTG